MRTLLSFFLLLFAPRNAKGADPLPAIASRFNEAADTIYQKVLLEQFRDYEERYGPGLVASLQEAQKTALIGAVKSFMLYTFFRHIEASGPEPVQAQARTRALEEAMGSKVAPSFMDYVDYHNPHFEDAVLAPAFKFGNDVGEIVGRIDRPFSFMASQQAMMIAEITKHLLASPPREEDASPISPSADLSPATMPPAVAVPPAVQKGAKYFGWWFAWGVFSGIMVLIVMKGGGLSWGAQLFILLGFGVFAGTVALGLYARKARS